VARAANRTLEVAAISKAAASRPVAAGAARVAANQAAGKVAGKEAELLCLNSFFERSI
jgi:hypothetical protein